VPVKILLRLVVNRVAGAISILVINWVGAGFGIHIPLNVLSALIVGILGVPGAALLAAYHYFGF
jgi:inhibitor of the pro-sigma K processing machinery